MASMKDIDERKNRLLALIDALQREEDMTRYLTIAQEMEKVAAELDSVAAAFGAEMRGKEKRFVGAVEVQLTPEQRARVQRETGATMTTVLLPDPSGAINARMIFAQPAEIEAEALKQARAAKMEREARENARMQLERQLRELEEQNELMAEKVAELRRQPEIRAILNPQR